MEKRVGPIWDDKSDNVFQILQLYCFGIDTGGLCTELEFVIADKIVLTDLMFCDNRAMRSHWMACTAPHKSGLDAEMTAI